MNFSLFDIGFLLYPGILLIFIIAIASLARMSPGNYRTHLIAGLIVLSLLWIVIYIILTFLVTKGIIPNHIPLGGVDV